MRYRVLGRTGLEVSEIGHGLWGMSGWSGSDDAESMRSLQLAADLCVTFFDTAWAYGHGHSDQLLGRLLAANPSKPLVAASKVPPANGRWPASGAYDDAFSRFHVLDAATAIRKALGQSAIDLLQYHVWDDRWLTGHLEEFLGIVAELKARKLIRFFGLSLNRWEPWNGLKAIETGLVDAVQVIYNIFDQSPEDELFPLCREQNVGVIARVPLDEGSLAGTLTKATTFPAGDWRAGYFGPENLGPTVDRVEQLKALVPEGMTLPEMALRFVLSSPDVSTTIVGMRREANVRMNTGVSDGTPLAPDLLRELRTHRWDRRPTRATA